MDVTRQKWPEVKLFASPLHLLSSQLRSGAGHGFVVISVGCIDGQKKHAPIGMILVVI